MNDKQRINFDDEVSEDEREEDVRYKDLFEELDFTRNKREEGHIYESIEEELGLDEVLRELSEFDPGELEDMEPDDLNDGFEDSRGG